MANTRWAAVRARTWTPAEIMKHIPKPRRKVWRQEKLVDEVYLQYRDQTEELPEPDLVERIFLIVMRRDRCLAVRHGDRHEPWLLPILEFDIDPRPEPLDPELDQDARRAALTQTISSVVEDTWQVPIVDWSQHTRVQMTARELQDQVEVGSRRYEMVVMAQAGEPLDLAEGNPVGPALLSLARDQQALARALLRLPGARVGLRTASDRGRQSESVTRCGNRRNASELVESEQP